MQDGSWLTASATEIIHFQPKAGIQNSNNEKVEVTGFKIFDTPVFIDSFLSRNNPIELTYKQNFFTVEFAVLNFCVVNKDVLFCAVVLMWLGALFMKHVLKSICFGDIEFMKFFCVQYNKLVLVG